MNAGVFNLLVRTKASAHYQKAGQRRLDTAPIEGATLTLACDGQSIAGVIEQIYVPPGCDEHCIGTIFLREVET